MTSKAFKKVALPEIISAKDIDFPFGIWCHKMMALLDKSLLKRADVINAYNDFCNVWQKHRGVIETRVNYRQRYGYDGDRFNPIFLTFQEEISTIGWGIEIGGPWRGLPWKCTLGYTYHCADDETKFIKKLEEDAVREECVATYKVLYDLISPSLVPKLKERQAIRLDKGRVYYCKILIRANNANLNKQRRLIDKYTAKIQEYEALGPKKKMAAIKRALAKIEECEKAMAFIREESAKYAREIAELEEKIRCREEAVGKN